MKIDHTFRQGSTHKVCQDYTAANSGRVVLCDGCSGAKHSDVGARALAYATLKQQSSETEYVIAGARVDSSGVLWQMGLRTEECYATLLYVDYCERTKKFRVVFCGDGSFLVRYKDGSTALYDIDFPDSHPYYIYYDGETMAAYLKQDHGQYVLSCHEAMKDQELEICYKGVHHVSDQKTGGGLYSLHYNEDVYENEEWNRQIDFIAIFSDGVKQIEGWDYKDVIKELTDFKNFSGKFVQRRVAACFKRNKWNNLDDFSMGVVMNDATEEMR